MFEWAPGEVRGVPEHPDGKGAQAHKLHGAVAAAAAKGAQAGGRAGCHVGQMRTGLCVCVGGGVRGGGGYMCGCLLSTCQPITYNPKP